MPFIESSEAIPEHVLRRMSDEDRRALGKAGMTMVEIEAKNDQKSERDLQNQIAGYLRLREIFPGQQRMDRKSNIVLGYPDFWFAYHGIPIALEVKVGKNTQSPEQVEAQAKLEANGWRYEVVRSLPEVKRILDEILKNKDCVMPPSE